MINLDKLDQEFTSALESADVESIQKIFESFDKKCRVIIEQELDQSSKKKLIQDCLEIQKNWQSKIIKLKAKVKGELADIKSNGKKIQKYLTSY